MCCEYGFLELENMLIHACNFSINNNSYTDHSIVWSSNQGNHGYSGNQKNAIQGQNPDMENKHTQQRTDSN